MNSILRIGYDYTARLLTGGRVAVLALTFLLGGCEVDSITDSGSTKIASGTGGTNGLIIQSTHADDNSRVDFSTEGL